MSTHGRPPSTLYTTTVLFLSMVLGVATVVGSVSLFVWLYLTPSLDPAIKWAIGSGVVAASAGALLRKLL